MRFDMVVACAVMISRQVGILLGAILVTVMLEASASAQQASDFNAIQKKANELIEAHNYPAALAEAQKLEAGVKARFGVDHVNYSTALGMMARVYQKQGNYREAEGFYKRALAIREKALGQSHPGLNPFLNNLADVYQSLRKYGEAEELLNRALAIKEKALGQSHPDVALALTNLANAYQRQHKYEQAEGLYKRALAIREKALGPSHPDVGESLDDLANMYTKQERYTEAESLYKRALTTWEGKRIPATALGTLNNLANIYEHQGKYEEAEAYHKRALAIGEEKLGKDHPYVANTLNNLALVYEKRGKYGEAEGFYKRALTIKEAKLGKDHPSVADTLSNLAHLYEVNRKYENAEELYKRALAIKEAKLGDDHRDMAIVLNNLGRVYRAEGKLSEAEELYKRSLAITEARLGKEHYQLATPLNDLANLYKQQLKYVDAETHYKRALAIAEMNRGKDHPDVAVYLENLSRLYTLQRKYEEALTWSRRSLAGIIAHAQMEQAGARRRGGAKDSFQQSKLVFHHVRLLSSVARLASEPSLGREAFEIGQWTIHSSAASALVQMASRQAKGEGALSQIVRERQDLEGEWHAADARLNAAVARGDVEAASELRRQLNELDRKFEDCDARLVRDFPDYAELANPKPLSVAAVQALLGTDEALVTWLVDPVSYNSESYVFALTRDGFEWATIELDKKALADKVESFRRGLDVDALRRGLRQGECTQAEADKRGLSPVVCGRVVAKECEEAAVRGLTRADCTAAEDPRKLFDPGIAHDLYDTLLKPIEWLIKDRHHLIVAPSGVLTALPFHLLVTETPAVTVQQIKTANDLAAYRDLAWLLNRHAVSVLPSVASLKPLRMFGRAGQATKPLIGFGDPIFDPAELPAVQHVASTTTASATRGYAEFWQGAGIDRARLAQLARLPETTDELTTVARQLGASLSDIHLRADASETEVKRLPLAEYRVVYFATHALVAGDVEGVAEPSLALTLPKEPSDTDDGLLTASEVVQLKLNADWVVLSACNTIAGEKPGAEALSGLARAFFYAGARALLVSHWAVELVCSNASDHLDI